MNAPGEGEGMRCFVAIELDPPVRAALTKLLRHSAAGNRDIRWCTPEQLHVTLKFLGEISPDRVRRICDILATTAAQVPPFVVKLAGLGAFPSPRSPRVLWCGLDDPAGGCRRWLELADLQLIDEGFEPEVRDFHPHITLGRARDGAGAAAMRAALEALPAPPPLEMGVDALTLFESRLGPGGACYTVVTRAPLTGTAN